MQYLDITQITNILRVAYKTSRRDHLLLLLSFTHGLRRGETATLTLEDVAEGKIRVIRLKGSLATIHPLRESDNLLFNEKMALAAWLEERRSESNALFPSRKGTSHLKPESVSKLAVRYMNAVEVPKELAHIHALKHACCSIQARAGAKIENIAQYVGHKDIKNTRTYLNVSDDEAAVSAFNALDSLTRKH